MAIFRGYQFARLYPDAVNNDATIDFYKANGYVSGPYLNSKDPTCLEYKTHIFSKRLTGDTLVLWKSRIIHLTEQIKKQKQLW